MNKVFGDQDSDAAAIAYGVPSANSAARAAPSQIEAGCALRLVSFRDTRE